MAISRTDILEAIGTASSYTSSSFTPPANSLLVVAMEWADYGKTKGQLSAGLTISGGGLTWTPQVGQDPCDTNSDNVAVYQQIWTAPVGGSPSSMTVTIGSVASATSPSYDTNIVAYTGHNVGSPIGATGSNKSNTNPHSGAFSLTLSGAPASTSMVFAALGAGPTGTTEPITNGSGWTEIYDSNTGDPGLQSQERTGSTSTSVDWVDVSTGGGTRWHVGGLAIEIKEPPSSMEVIPPQGNLVLSGTAPNSVNSGSPSFTLPQTNLVFSSDAPSVNLTLKNVVWKYVGVSGVVSVTGTSHALTEPSGVQEGDLLVAVISSRIASTTSITLPSGGEWTLVTEQKSNNVLTTTSALASGLMAYCRRGASAPNLTFTHPTSPSVALGRIVAYRGMHPTGLKDTQTSFTTAVNTTSVSGTGLTTAEANELIVVGACGGQEAAWSAFDAATDPTTSSGTNSGQTADPIAGTWQERADSNTTTGADTSLAIADAIRATAGATGNLTVTASLGAGHVIVAGAFKLDTNTYIPVPQGDVQLSSSLPPTAVIASAGSGVNINTPQGNVALSPTAPTVGLTANRDITSPQGNLALSPTTPSRVVNVNRDTPQGNLALSPTAPSRVLNVNRDTPQGNLALSPTAPTSARTDNRDISSPQGNLVTSPTAPSVVRTLNVNRDTPQGNLALSGTAPDIQTGAGVGKSPAARDLILSPTAPTVARTDNRDLAVPQGNLATSPTAPTVTRSANRDIAVPQGNLALSPTTPTVQTGAGITAFPAARDLVLSPTAPTVARTANRDIAVPQGNLATSPTAPSINVSISVNPAARDLVLSPTAPTVATTAHRNINVAQANLALSPTAPARVVDSVRLPAARDLILSSTAPTVARTDHRNISPAARDLLLTTEAPSTGGAMNRLPAQGNLALSATAPTVARTANRNISPAARDLLLSAIAPTLINTDHHPILVPQGNLTLSTLPAQLIPGTYAYPLSGNLTLSRTTPSVAVDPIRFWTKANVLEGQRNGPVNLFGQRNGSNDLEGGWT